MVSKIPVRKQTEEKSDSVLKNIASGIKNVFSAIFAIPAAVMTTAITCMAGAASFAAGTAYIMFSPVKSKHDNPFINFANKAFGLIPEIWENCLDFDWFYKKLSDTYNNKMALDSFGSESYSDHITFEVSAAMGSAKDKANNDANLATVYDQGSFGRKIVARGFDHVNTSSEGNRYSRDGGYARVQAGSSPQQPIYASPIDQTIGRGY